MELEVTWERAVRVWWAFLWRSIVAVFASMLICGILGFVIGFVGTLLHVPIPVLYGLVMILSFGIGLAISIVPLKLILGKDFGEFKLVLVGRQ